MFNPIEIYFFLPAVCLNLPRIRLLRKVKLKNPWFLQL